MVRFVNKVELEAILSMTSLYFEGGNQQSTTVFDNLPLAFKEKALEWIVGFEIEITEMDTVFKLSQDRDAKSYQNIIMKLKEQDESGRVIAQEMEKREKDLFAEK